MLGKGSIQNLVVLDQRGERAGGVDLEIVAGVQGQALQGDPPLVLVPEAVARPISAAASAGNRRWKSIS
jgi:hypothetical protein